jgi:signal transduction histidine kinase
VNLVKNAIEALDDFYTATDDGFPGRVDVTVRQDEHYVHAEVRDNGPGIDEGNLQAIFDPFYTTKPPGRGTGLGLNIVYRIVTKYQGQITVESSPGEGTAFVIRFPREE